MLFTMGTKACFDDGRKAWTQSAMRPFGSGGYSVVGVVDVPAVGPGIRKLSRRE